MEEGFTHRTALIPHDLPVVSLPCAPQCKEEKTEAQTGQEIWQGWKQTGLLENLKFYPIPLSRFLEVSFENKWQTQREAGHCPWPQKHTGLAETHQVSCGLLEQDPRVDCPGGGDCEIQPAKPETVAEERHLLFFISLDNVWIGLRMF